MAYQKKKEDPSYEEFRKELGAESLGNLYIFHGEETYLRDKGLEDMKALLLTGGLDDFNYHLITGKEYTLSRLHGAVNALPMMSERTMVVVTDVDMDKGDREGLMELLGDLPDYVCLVFVYDVLEFKLDSRGKLAKLVKEKGKIVNFIRQQQDKLEKWIAVRFQALGHEISRTEANYLVFRCGDLMNGLISEIGKIGAYAKGRKITRQDIDAVSTPQLDAVIFNLTDAVAARNFDQAFRVLGELFHMQEPPIKLMASLAKQLRQLYAARLGGDRQKNTQWLMELYGLREFQAQKLMQAARRFSPEWYRWALLRCEAADMELKSTGADGQEVLVNLLLELAQRQAA
ncbi:MAG: DNA polymerase III subunit delta [Oscillospiraceae bacterium]|nr:DNA polymerase III subunit delta [Oscillospiraceae bacterium]